ncbi:MAG: DUF4097 domain-containing protein [Clostridiaceae bacterium]|jgi:hypothetical protein|nr:DUF4097 domain-containing protein [Clostridiaceae bacterium]
MKTWHNIVKYAAIALAVLLIIGVISGIMHMVYRFVPGSASSVTDEYKTYVIKNEMGVLEIDIHAANLEVRTATDSNITVESNYKDLTVKENNSTLLIKDKKAFNFNAMGKIMIKLYIPENKFWNKVDIRTGAGKTDVENLQARFINMKFGAGKAILQNMSASDSASIETGAGQLTIKNSSFCNLDLNMGVGQFEFSGTLTGRNELKMGVGSSHINLTGSLNDYRLKIEKGIGDIYVDNEKVKNDAQLGQGDTDIFFEGGVGSVKIDFSE